MARRATGSIRRTADGFEARITVEGNKRIALPLGPRDEEGARQRGALVASYAARLRDCGLLTDPTAQAVLKDVARRNGAAHEQARRVMDQLLGGDRAPAGTRRTVPTFRDVAHDWTSGKLHEKFPDHVKAKRTADGDRRLLTTICAIPFEGSTIGDVPIDRFGIEQAEHALRGLPESAERPSTRRHYGQCIARVLGLAVYPLRLINANPLPKGFLPKVGTPPLYPYIHPGEEAALLACRAVPLALRMAHGFSVREGLRASELAALNVQDFAFTDDGASVTLDANKTDDPRSWALRPDTAKALRDWFKMRKAEPTDPAFVDVNDGRLETPELAKRLRRALLAAGVDRRALHHAGKNTRPYRWHDARGSFITIASANGKSEAWIADRTGHRSSQMINRYRRPARQAGELGLGDWSDLSTMVPELAAVEPDRVTPGSIPPRFRPEAVGRQGLEPWTDGLKIRSSTD